MRDHHDVDRLGVDARGREIGPELADRAFARCALEASPFPVSMTTSLPPVFTTIGAKWIVILSLSHIGRRERRVDVVLLGVEDEPVGQREGARAIGHHGDLDRRRSCSGRRRLLACRWRKRGARRRGEDVRRSMAACRRAVRPLSEKLDQWSQFGMATSPCGSWPFRSLAGRHGWLRAGYNPSVVRPKKGKASLRRWSVSPFAVPRLY